ILASLAAAFFWGMAHALSPGHGKTIVAAYLVGRRGTPWHAAALGAIVTATHTIGVFALGLVTLALSAFIVPEQLYPWLNLVSGVLVVVIGATVAGSRLRRRRGDAHDNSHGHHHHEHDAPSRRSLIAVGITGGLLPCPSALVVLLAAISLHRVAFGMLLIVAFSAGLALSITGIGLVAVLAKQIFKRASFEGRLVRLLPAVSALVILAAALLGLAWGLGHATSLFAFGLPIVVFKAYLPETVQAAAETSVGVMIALLALWLLVRWHRGLFHLHQDHGPAHAHGTRRRFHTR